MHLFLIGFRATGKSTVARRLSELLQRPFIDLDREICLSSGLSIAEIFKASGEAQFRELEAQQLRLVCNGPPSVIALGGGIVLLEQNRTCLQRYGRVAWLSASPVEIEARMHNDPDHFSNRPALTELSATDEVATILNERMPLYAACADYTIATDKLTVEQVAEKIAKWWQRVDTNNQPT